MIKNHWTIQSFTLFPSLPGTAGPLPPPPPPPFFFFLFDFLGVRCSRHRPAMTVIQLVVIISNTICSKSSFIVSKTSGVARLAMNKREGERETFIEGRG